MLGCGKHKCQSLKVLTTLIICDDSQMAVNVPRLISFEIFRLLSLALIAFVQSIEGIHRKTLHLENGR